MGKDLKSSLYLIFVSIGYKTHACTFRTKCLILVLLYAALEVNLVGHHFIINSLSVRMSKIGTKKSAESNIHVTAYMLRAQYYAISIFQKCIFLLFLAFENRFFSQ